MAYVARLKTANGTAYEQVRYETFGEYLAAKAAGTLPKEGGWHIELREDLRPEDRATARARGLVCAPWASSVRPNPDEDDEAPADDASSSPAVQPLHGRSAAPDGGALRARWDASAQLRAEFGDRFEAYEAYERARAAGRVRIYGER